MNDNNVIEWLRRYYDNQKIDEKNLKPLLHFSLLWNLFEHKYFTDNKHLDPKRLIDLCDISYMYLNDENLNAIFIYFKKRYFPNNELNNRFTTLKLNNRSRNNQPSNHTLCQITFLAINPSKNDKVKTVFLVIHRFRNNLFHGRKNPETLNIYEYPFQEINRFLMHFIEITADNNSINNQRQIL